MSRQTESKKALSALSNHWEAIDEACFENGGLMATGDSGDVASKSLLGSKLAYLTDDESGVQVHTSVRKVLNRATSRIRFREKHGEFSGLVESLEYAIEHYRQTKINAELNAEAYEEVRDIAVEMMDSLSESTQMFHHVVNNEFSTIVRVDTKIAQISRCKNEIVRINDVLGRLSVKNLREWVGTDLKLESLVMKRLKLGIDETLRDLDATNHKLVEMLLKIQNDKNKQKKNEIIDSSHVLFGDGGAFLPSLVDVDDLPSNMMLGGTIRLGGHVPIYSSFCDDTVDEVVAYVSDRAAKVDRVEPKKIPSSSTDDARGMVKELNSDEVDETLEDMFSALSEGVFASDVVSSKALHSKLELDIPLDDWLMLVSSYIDAQPRSAYSSYDVEFVSSVMLPKTGNILVTDIKFVKVR